MKWQIEANRFHFKATGSWEGGEGYRMTWHYRIRRLKITKNKFLYLYKESLHGRINISRRRKS
jgi:hypothetical protein